MLCPSSVEPAAALHPVMGRGIGVWGCGGGLGEPGAGNAVAWPRRPAPHRGGVGLLPGSGLRSGPLAQACPGLGRRSRDEGGRTWKGFPGSQGRPSLGVESQEAAGSPVGDRAPCSQAPRFGCVSRLLALCPLLLCSLRHLSPESLSFLTCEMGCSEGEGAAARWSCQLDTS